MGLPSESVAVGTALTPPGATPEEAPFDGPGPTWTVPCFLSSAMPGIPGRFSQGALELPPMRAAPSVTA
ncbi:hypothetical protein QR77_13145 [Streptomyces sp. 150FB]|nr:hypothetical protein QR77_13145 [Streptomyces sp. 150FB]